MSQHSLIDGALLIEALASLGRSLSYVAEKEMSVEPGRGRAPAVDVAWLADKSQKYPLMIFEVESRASNAAANNPVKVFAQRTERFEKPLFFFHVFMAGGTQTTRLENLQQLFGTYNYRTYRMDRGEGAALIKDVLSQHRRLQQTLNLGSLLNELVSEAWRDLPLTELLDHTEKLGFVAEYLQEYASRAGTDARFEREYFRCLRQSRLPWSGREAPRYASYLGYHWYEPLHIGLLASEGPEEDDWLARLRDWQERSSYMRQIGPQIGLDREYDDFVLGVAPVLWALLAVLMADVKGSSAYICDQLFLVLERMKDAIVDASFFSAVWLLHIAAATRDQVRYERARKFVNERQGVSRDVLLRPPSMVPIVEPDEHWAFRLASERESVPELPELLTILRAQYQLGGGERGDLLKLAFDVLTKDEAIYDWSPRVMRQLVAMDPKGAA
jgi:hypothetical protein